MRFGLICALLISVALLSVLESPATSSSISSTKFVRQDKAPQLPREDEALPPGAIWELACPPFWHQGAVNCVAASHDGKQIVTSTLSAAFLWDAATGKKLKSFAVKPQAMALTPTGDLLALASAADGIAIYELPAGKKRLVIANPGQHTLGLALAPDGKTLAAVGGPENARTIRLWNTVNGQTAGTLPGHALEVFDVAYHPDGKSLYSFSQDSTVRQWDLATMKEICRWSELPGWQTHHMNLSADGKTLALLSVRRDSTPGAEEVARVRLLDTATMAERFGTNQPGVTGCYGFALSADGRYVAAAMSAWSRVAERLVVWDSWTCKHVVLDPNSLIPKYCLSFLGTSTTLVGGRESGVVRLWNVVDGSEFVLTRKRPVVVPVFAFSPSGSVLAFGLSGSDLGFGQGGPIYLFDAVKGTHIRMLGEAERHSSCASIAFSPDGQLVLGEIHDSTTAPKLDLWQANTGQHLRSFRSTRGRPAFAPDGKTVAVGDGKNNVCLWDITKGTTRRLLGHSEKIFSANFSPSGDMVASASNDRTIRLWNAASGLCVRTITVSGLSETSPVWFSADASLMFVHHLDGVGTQSKGVIDIFETATGLKLASIDPLCDYPKGIVAADDGRTLLVSASHGKFRAIDVTRGKILGPDVAYGGSCQTAEFSSDRSMLALGYEDGLILLFKSPSFPKREPLPSEVDEVTLAKLWQSLAGTDARAAFLARWQLCAAAKQTVPLMAKALQPVAPPDAKQIAAWIAQLDSNSFKIREKAMRELEKAGDTAELALRKALDENPPLEVRQRAKLVLAKLTTPTTGATVRTLRAIPILETIGGDEARAILTLLAIGAPGARITVAAQAALARMEKK